MLLDRPLCLEPVKIYLGARYPQAGQPLNVDLADPRSWPFSAAVTGLLIAATGLTGCFGVTQDDAGSSPESPTPSTGSQRGAPAPSESSGSNRPHDPDRLAPKSPAAAEPALENPFTMAKSQLPPSAVWGKGSPGILPEEIAVSAILEVFASRGIQTKTNVVYAQDGVAVNLDGLGAGSKVGFELVSSDFAGGKDFQWPDDWKTDPATGKQIPVINLDDPSSLSQLEMEKLDQDAAAGSRYVAMINPLDPRFVYATSDFPSEFWESLGVANKDEQAAVKALVAAVHEFLDFVDQQGAL